MPDNVYLGFSYVPNQKFENLYETKEALSMGTIFKDLYKIVIETNHKLNTGDGLKLISNDNSISMGVGNVEYISDNIAVYGKNIVEIKRKWLYRPHF